MPDQPKAPENDKAKIPIYAWLITIVPCTLSCALVLWKGEDAVANLICALADKLIIVFIVSCFMLGIACFVFSVRGLWMEEEARKTLEENAWKKAKQQILAACAESMGSMREEEQKQRKNQQEDKNLWEGLTAAPFHLLTRLRAMGVADGQDTHTFTSLKDMHELTQQSELSRTCSSGLNTIVSFLLILGILGTLSGIHGVIRDGVKDIQELAPALEPSQWAVGGTVILLILRGIYLSMVDRYLYRLDTLTIMLLPALREDQDEEQNARNTIFQALNARTQGGQTRNEGNTTPWDDKLPTFTGVKSILANAVGTVKNHLPPAQPDKARTQTPATHRAKDNSDDWDTGAMAEQAGKCTAMRGELERVRQLKPEHDGSWMDRESVSMLTKALSGRTPGKAERQMVQTALGRSITTQSDMDYALELLKHPNKPAPAYTRRPTYTPAPPQAEASPQQPGTGRSNRR